MKSSNYLISTDATELSRKGENSDQRVLPDGSKLREELAAVIYETNILGLKGPRKMTIAIPAMTHEHKRIAVKPRCDNETLLEIKDEELAT